MIEIEELTIMKEELENMSDLLNNYLKDIDFIVMKSKTISKIIKPLQIMECGKFN